MDPELLKRITARRAELDELEERLAARLITSAVCRCPRAPSTTSPIYCDAI
ncbi:hypothetical protein [Streptomyces sp. AK02-01A]|uniref:hypothetical protein n=1 Tax=Streptomyces sp. AK02-01A TaxID=3028648 RepID=UPI0029A11774|nr:hypothetical protein [Streptomyces sp. AK02-01A]MDX3853140.1 hypothetical protein [Streptomyces sp. AK02-01A]